MAIKVTMVLLILTTTVIMIMLLIDDVDGDGNHEDGDYDDSYDDYYDEDGNNGVDVYDGGDDGDVVVENYFPFCEAESVLVMGNLSVCPHL